MSVGKTEENEGRSMLKEISTRIFAERRVMEA